MGSHTASPSGRDFKRWIVPALGYLVSIASLIWVYWGFDWEVELPKFAQANWYWVAVALVSDLLIYFCQGWRWSLLLRPVGSAGWLRSTQAVFIGLLANEVLPFRTGELIRGYTQARWTSILYSVVFSSIVIERMFDGILLVSGFYLVTQFVEVPGFLRDISFTLLLIVAAAAGLVVLVAFHKHHAHSAVAKSRWAATLWHVIEGLHIMARSGWFLASGLVSVLYFALQVVPIYALARGYALDLSIGAAAAVLMILRLGTVLPQAPGNVGGFQFFAVAGLSLFGIERAAATSFATVMFLAVTIPLWLGGAVAAALAGVRVKDLQQEANIRARDTFSDQDQKAKPAIRI
jgi:uncharacterized protein (TIRG00374 family)